MSQIYKISFDGKWFCCLEEKTVLLRRTIDTFPFDLGSEAVSWRLLEGLFVELTIHCIDYILVLVIP